MRILFKLSIYFFICAASAQTNTIKVIKGDIVKDSYKEIELLTLADGEGGLFELSKRKKIYYIKHFDGEMKLDDEFIYEVNKNRIISAFVLDKKLHFIDLVGEKQTKKAIFTIYTQNQNEFSFSAKTLFSVDYKSIGFLSGINRILSLFGDDDRTRNENNYPGVLKISPNGEYYSLSFDDFENRKEAYRFYLFDKNHNLIFEKILKLPYKDKNYFFYDFEIDEQSKAIFFLGKHYPNGARPKFKMPKYEYELYRLTADGELKKSIDNDGLKFNDLTLHLNENMPWISCLGLYSESSDFSTEGLIYIPHSRNTLELVFSNYSPFTEQFKIDTKRKKDKYFNLYLDHILETDNGELLVTGEERKILNLDGHFGNFQGTTHHYNDLFVAKLGLQGNLIWSRGIAKSQEYSDISLMSYLAFMVKGTLQIVFNAANKVETLKNGSTLFTFNRPKTMVPFKLSFDDQGEYLYEALLSTSEKAILKINDRSKCQLEQSSDLFLKGLLVSKKQWFKFELQ